MVSENKEDIKKFKSLKKGMFVRWRCDQDRRRWNAVCLITEKTKDSINVLCLDDFKSIGLHAAGEAVRNEITIVDKIEVIQFLNDHRKATTTLKRKSIEEHQRRILEYDELIEKIDNFYTDLAKKI